MDDVLINISMTVNGPDLVCAFFGLVLSSTLIELTTLNYINLQNKC